ncbi:hypothetical protein MMC25_002574 [Agyrium rufum]|nr:hypothetical protein [Agyrium rufum]
MADEKRIENEGSMVDIEKEAVSPGAGEPSSKIMKHANDADEAMKAFVGFEGEALVLDEATNKSLLRKIDWHLMPERKNAETAISYASVTGIKTDIHLQGDNYQWLSSMFYFGYIAWEYPTNRLLQRLPLAKYSAFCIIMWGLVLCCFAAVKNFAGAVAVRFMLGVFEAAVTPGFALFTSQWYTKKEQGTRTGIWFSFNGFAQIFGGLIAYAIAKGVERHGAALAPWKIIFLVTGLLTSAMGVVFLFIMPDSQLNAKWLTPAERRLAIERVRINQQGIGNKHFKAYQLKEAFTDPLTWAFTFYALTADIPNGGISNFFSQLIVSFGYTADQSLLYGTPGGVVEIVSLIVCGYLGDRYGHRLLIASSGLFISILGMLLIVALPLSNNGGRLAGYYLTQASPTVFVALLSLISTNVAGYTKKTTVAALYLIAYCAGNIIDVYFIYWYCKRQNRKKAELRAQPTYTKLGNQEWLDLTDRENPEFVYTL